MGMKGERDGNEKVGGMGMKGGRDGNGMKEGGMRMNSGRDGNERWEGWDWQVTRVECKKAVGGDWI